MGETRATGGGPIDERVLQEVLEEVLFELGHRLAEARCGIKALELLTEHVGNGHSHPGSDPTDEDVITGAEVADGLRFLLHLVLSHIERTSAKLEPRFVLHRVRVQAGRHGDLAS